MESTLYRELQRMDISYAINEMVELALPRDTIDKILMVDVRFNINDFDADFSTNKHLILIFYRPNNYTFVGRLKEDYLLPESEIEYLSNHDSGWRQDGTSSTISKFAQEVEEEIKSMGKNFFMFTTFEAHFIDGNLRLGSNDFSVKFIKK